MAIVLEKFNPKEESWPRFIQRLEYFFITADIPNNTENAEKRKSFILQALGVSLFNNFCNLVGDKLKTMTYADIVHFIESFIGSNSSQIKERFQFQNRCQHRNESLADYMSHLQRMSTQCNFDADIGNVTNNRLRDQFVWGLANKNTQQFLLQQPSISMENAVELAQTFETIELLNPSPRDIYYSLQQQGLILRIIDYVPIFRWPYLELVDRIFRKEVLKSWSALKKIDIDENFKLNLKKLKKEPLNLLNSIIDKLLLRAKNIESISGSYNFFNDILNLETIDKLAQFNFLKQYKLLVSMTFNDFNHFMKSSKSRGRLKKIEIKINLTSSFPFQLLESHQLSMFGEIPDRESVKLEKLYFCMNLNTPFINNEWFLLESIDASTLTVLELAGAFIDEDLLTALISRCRFLKHLWFALDCVMDCQGEPRAEYQNLFDAIINLKELIFLKIKHEQFHLFINERDCGCKYSISNHLIRMFEIFGRQNRLEELVLKGLVNHRIIDAIAINLNYLTALELHFVSAPTNRLRELELEGLVDPLNRLITKSTKLKKLLLYEMKIDENTMIAMTKNLNQLEYLDTSCPNISDARALSSLTDLKNLKTLHLYYPHLSKEISNYWNINATWPLESLLANYKGLIDLSFLQKFPNLRQLDIWDNGITDDDLKPIPKYSTNLRDLVLSWCRNITKNGIQLVIDGCPKLKMLQFHAADWIPQELKIDESRNIAFKIDKTY